MPEEFDPYYKWLGIPPEDQPPTHYQLLALRAFEDDPDVIANAADQRMAHLRTFQAGKHGPLSQKILNEIAAARVTLLNPQKKVAYDSALAEQVAARQAALVPPITAPPTGVLPDVLPPRVAKRRASTGRKSGRKKSVAGPLLLSLFIIAVGAGAVVGIIRYKKGQTPFNRTTGTNGVPAVDDESKTAADDEPAGVKQPSAINNNAGKAQADFRDFSFVSSHELGGGGGEPFRKVANDGRMVVGFDVTTGTNSGTHVLASIAPIYSGDASGPRTGREMVWVEDEIPVAKEIREENEGDGTGESLWAGRAEQPVFSGEKSLRRKVKGISQIHFSGANQKLAISPGDRLFVHVYLDPKDPPKAIMPQFISNTWDHRAVWGAEDAIPYGRVASYGNRRVGDLPPVGRWTRLEIDPTMIDLSPGMVLSGMSFTQAEGTVYWDKAGIQKAPATADQPLEVARILAKEGYAVGGMLVRFGQTVDAVRIVFMRITGDRLDKTDHYLSPWIGGDFGLGPELIGGDGRPVVGVYGRQGNTVDAIGVVQRRAAHESATPAPIGVSNLFRFAGGNEVYLADLPRRQLVAHQWRVVPRLSGNALQHSIPLHPMNGGDQTGTVVYALGGDYRRLVGSAGINDMGSVKWSNNKVEFKIEGDGRTLWTSQPLNRAGQPESFDVDVSGVSLLKLTTRGLGENTHWAHAVFFEPKLYVQGTPANAIANNSAAKNNTAAKNPNDPSSLIGVDTPYVPPRRGGRFSDLLEDNAAVRQADDVKKLPVPSAEERANAKKLVDGVYADEIAAAKSRDEKLALASKLFRQAGQTPPDSPERFVLLEVVLKLATEIGEWRGIHEAVNDLARWYDVPHLEMKAEALAKADDIDRTDLANDAVRMLNDLLDEAVRSDRYDLADRFATLGARVRRKAVHAYHLHGLSKRIERLKQLRDAYEDVKAAEATLKTNPDDSDANLVVGRYLAILKDEWRAGIPHLAKGSDEQLKSLAQQELRKSLDGADQANIGDAWVSLAEKTRDDDLKAIYQDRALAWYGLAKTKLAGVALTKVEQSIESLEGRHGLKGEYFTGTNFERKVLDRVDPLVDFNWVRQAPVPELTPDNFSIRWTGFIAAPAVGQYKLALEYDGAVRVAIDGRSVFDSTVRPSGAAPGKRAGARAALSGSGRAEEVIPFTRAARMIRIEFSDPGGPARCRLLWQQKDGFDEEPVPTEALFPDKIAAQKGFGGR